jgi:hypothetical protein
MTRSTGFKCTYLLTRSKGEPGHQRDERVREACHDATVWQTRDKGIPPFLSPACMPPAPFVTTTLASGLQSSIQCTEEDISNMRHAYPGAVLFNMSFLRVLRVPPSGKLNLAVLRAS